MVGRRGMLAGRRVVWRRRVLARGRGVRRRMLARRAAVRRRSVIRVSMLGMRGLRVGVRTSGSRLYRG